MISRERWQADVVVVGAGVAGLSTAIRLCQRVKSHNEAVESGKLKEEKLPSPTVLVIEKGISPGSHILSGALVDPRSLYALFPDFQEKKPPIEGEVISDPFYFLTSRLAFRLPYVPHLMRSKGCLMTSLSQFTRWLSQQAETLGIHILSGFSGVDFLREGEIIRGVRLGDRGIDKNGNPKSTVVYGEEIEAKVTVLAEGVHGRLTQLALEHLGLGKDRMPQSTVLGIKEIVQLPSSRLKPGTAIHTFGFPHDGNTFGGGFVYWRPENQVAIGLATGLDYKNPLLDPHHLFLQWKSHPLIRKFLSGGKVIEYGAKSIPEGGYFAIPQLVANGLVIVGDSAGLVNAVRLKGIHLAIQSGMDAGDAIFECWKKQSFTQEILHFYPQKFFNGWPGKELYRVRNLHQGFQYHRMMGILNIGLHTVSFGLWPFGKWPIRPEWSSLAPLSKKKPKIKIFSFPSSPLMLDKLTDVFFSGTQHEENQPSHITIKDPNACIEICKREFDCPCTRFCPAQVYEWIEEEKTIRVNFTNCLHCQTCEVKDPLQNIIWRLPEGGGGPRYKNG